MSRCIDDAAIARVLAETRRYEEITRTGEPLQVTPPTTEWKSTLCKRCWRR